MPAYEEDLSEFGRYDAQVLGLSIDTMPTIKAWAKSLGKISYPLLSDFWPHGQTALKYGVLRAEGFTERALFIVDKQGKIAERLLVFRYLLPRFALVGGPGGAAETQ